jgi:hypothetical protein
MSQLTEMDIAVCLCVKRDIYIAGNAKKKHVVIYGLHIAKRHHLKIEE